MRRRVVPLVLLAVGWAAGLAVYFGAPPEEQLPFQLTEDAKLRYDQLERFGGKTAVFSAQASDFVASLWHGARLGITIGVLATLVAALWWWFDD